MCATKKYARPTPQINCPRSEVNESLAYFYLNI